MAFDPDAYLKGVPAAAPEQPKAFDPDAYLASTAPRSPGPYRDKFIPHGQVDVPHLPPREQVDSPPAEPVGRVEAGMRGLGSGLTYGWMDKLAGGMYASGFNPAMVSGGGMYSMRDAAVRNIEAGDPTGTRTAREAEAASRERTQQARREQPGAFLAGEVVGSVAAPGPKKLLPMAGLQAANAAAQSDEDTLEGKLVEGAKAGGGALAAGAVVKGTLTGGSYALRKLVGEAPARVEARATNALLEGTPARTVQDPAIAKLGGKAEIPKVLKEEGLEKALHGKAGKLHEALDSRMDEVGGRLGAIYDKVVAKDAGVPPEFLRDRIMRLADKHRTDPETAQSIRNYANALRAEFNEAGAMNARELHDVVRVLGKRGYGANPMNPSLSSQTKREIRSEVLGVLQDHVDDVAKRHPDVGSLAELKALNKRYSRLHAIDDIAEAKAARDERYSPTLGQRAMQVARYGTSAAGALGAAQQLAEGNVGVAAVGALATGAALAAPHVIRAADRMAATIADSRVANILRGATTMQDLVSRAVQVGIPRETALEIARQAEDEPPAMLPAPAPAAPLVSGR